MGICYLMELYEWVFAILLSYTSGYLLSYGAMGVGICSLSYGAMGVGIDILWSYGSGYLLSYGAMPVGICYLMELCEWVFAMSGYLLAIDAHRQFPAALPSHFCFSGSCLLLLNTRCPYSDGC